jgi:hypothetical protein
MINEFQQSLANYELFSLLVLALAAALAVLAVNWQRLQSILPNDFDLLLFGLALLARLAGIGTAPLWYDESFTAAMVGLDWQAMIAATVYDVHPPLFYLTEAMITGGRINAYTLRFGPAVCGALAAVLAYRIARLYVREGRARWAGLLAAFLPGLVLYGQDARMYPLLALLVLLAYYAALQRRWPVYAGAIGLALYTHNYGILYAAAIAIPLVIRQDTRRSVILWSLIPAVLYLPWLPVLVQQFTAVNSTYWIAPLSPGRTVIEPFLMLGAGLNLPGGLALAVLAGLIGLTVLGIRGIFRLESITGRWIGLFTLILGPVALAVAVSVLFRPLYLSRGFIVLFYVLPIVWVYGLDTLPARSHYAAAAVLAAALIVTYTGAYDSDPDLQHPAESLPSGATVFYTNIEPYLIMRHYRPDCDHILRASPGNRVELTDESRAALGIVQLDAPPPDTDFVIVAESLFTPAALAARDQQLATGPATPLYDNPGKRATLYDWRGDHD